VKKIEESLAAKTKLKEVKECQIVKNKIAS
jgi:hypothetical protein